MTAPRQRRALVTGATGGLGLALVEGLVQAGYTVRATGRDGTARQRLERCGAEVALVDLTEPDAARRLCDGVDAVFHAAALSSPWGAEAAFRRINVEATERLLAAAREGGSDAFVFVSSPSVYARPRDQLNLTEDDPPAARPMNAYAATKGEAERRVLAANAPGFSTIAVRPRAIVGPDDRVLLPRVLRLVRQGRFPVMRGGRALLELTDVRDAVQALLLADARRARAAGRVYNVSGGRPVAVRDLALGLAEALDRPIRLVDLPAGLVMAAAAVLEAACKLTPGRPEPPLTPYGAAALTYSQTFDLTRARNELGYAPRHDPLATAAAVARAGAGR